MTTPFPLSARPHILSDYVRGLVAARAVAGATGETWHQAVAACRLVARDKLGKARLAPREADEVDALVMAARAHVFERANPIVTPTLVPAYGMTVPGMLAPRSGASTATPTVHDPMVAVAASLARVERMLTVLFAVVMRCLPVRIREMFASEASETRALPPAPCAPHPLESALVLEASNASRPSYTYRALPAHPSN